MRKLFRDLVRYVSIGYAVAEVIGVIAGEAQRQIADRDRPQLAGLDVPRAELPVELVPPAEASDWRPNGD